MEIHSLFVISAEIVIDLLIIIGSGYLVKRLYGIYRNFGFDVILNFIFGFILLGFVALSELFGYFAIEGWHAKIFFKAVGVFAVLAEFNYAAVLSKIKHGVFDLKIAIVTGLLTYFVIFDIFLFPISIFKTGFMWDYTQYCSFYCNLVTGGFITGLALYQLKITSEFLRIIRDLRRKIIKRGYIGSVLGALIIGIAFLLEPWLQTTYLMYFGGFGVFVYVFSFAYIFIKEPHLAFITPYRVKAVIVYNKKGQPIVGEYYEYIADENVISTLMRAISLIHEHKDTSTKGLVKYIKLYNDILIFHAQNNIIGIALVEKYHPYIEKLFKRTINEISQLLELEGLNPNILTRELTQKIQKFLSERISSYTFAPRIP